MFATDLLGGEAAGQRFSVLTEVTQVSPADLKLTDLKHSGEKGRSDTADWW